MEHNSESKPEGGPSRGISPFLIFLLASVAVLVAFYIAFFQEKTDIQIAAYGSVLYTFFLVLFIFLLALGLGSWIFRGFFPSSGDSPHLLFHLFVSSAAGLGFLGCLVLLLGAFHVVRSGFLSIFFIILFIACIPRFILLYREIRLWFQGFSTRKIDPLSLAAIIMIAFIVVLYLFCALPAPVQYDVLEYHLGSLQQSLMEGGIHPQGGVFYSQLPFGVEALYAAGLALEGERGYLSPKLINFGLWLLSCLGIYVLAGLLGFERPWRLFGVILFGMNRLVFSVGLDAFVEIGQTLYVVAALACWVVWWRTEGVPTDVSHRPLYLSFVFWGLSLGAKYSILGIGIIPFFLVLLPTGLFLLCKGGGPAGFAALVRLWVRFSLIGIGITAASFLPWMIRNACHTGNPLFPFFSGLLPSVEIWTPEQMAYYFRVNRAVPFFSLSHWGLYLTKWKDLGPLYVLPAIPAILFIRRRKWPLAFLVSIALGYFFWNLFLQPPVRFLVPLVPMLILVVIFVLRQLSLVRKSALLLILPYLVYVISCYQLQFVGMFNRGLIKAGLFCYDQGDFLQEQLGGYWEAAEKINEELPPEARLLFLYEARTFYVRRPVRVNTVFDKSPLLSLAKKAKNAPEIRSMLLREGYTHVLVNEVELNRFIHTYAPLSRYEREGIMGALFQDPDANLTAFEELYGPYHFDGHYGDNRGKIRQFVSGLKKGIIYETMDNRGLRLYIAQLQ